MFQVNDERRNPVESTDKRLRTVLHDPATFAHPTDTRGDFPRNSVSQLFDLFTAQIQSRHLDFAARWLQNQGRGYYTIGSAGHEANAAVGLLSEVTDPALLHYRSGGFFAGRSIRAGSSTAIRDVLLSLTGAAADPISGGRHKVFGHPELHIIPQTSTISSHLPRALGVAFSLGLARTVGRGTPWPHDAAAICSFGDASINHSTALGAINAASYLEQRGHMCPLLLVCEDNGLGISTPSPRGWTETMLRAQPGLTYFQADGTNPLMLLSTVGEAIDTVRESRSPAILHLRTVRYMGHAGSDVESAYRSRAAIESDFALDPIVHTAKALVAAGIETPGDVAQRYEDMRETVMGEAERVVDERQLQNRDEVMGPLRLPDRVKRVRNASARREPSRTKPLTLAQSINATLDEVMERFPEALIFGEDVGRKGGVYGVTRGLQKRHGRARVFDTLLDEQTILGTALGSALAGFLPIPEFQYLAYVHNAEDQLRGEAASLPFFSNGHYKNPMVLRIAGLAYQGGFGGHFHNDNSLAVLRDIPGIVVAVASHPGQAPALLRSCIDLARNQGRVCVFVEPIALYHRRDLFEGDTEWTSSYDPEGRLEFGEVTRHGSGTDVALVTFGNGAHMSRRAAGSLAEHGVEASVVDLHWVTPLPEESLREALSNTRSVLVIDETRDSGGVGESIVSTLITGGCSVPVGRVCSADSFVPLGPAAYEVLLNEDQIVDAALEIARIERQ